MLYQAAVDLQWDLDGCFMIGDKQTDIEAGKVAGCKTILIAQKRSKDCELDFVALGLFQSIPIS